MKATSTAGQRHATLEALGYVCEEVKHDVLEQAQVRGGERGGGRGARVCVCVEGGGENGCRGRQA